MRKSKVAITTSFLIVATLGLLWIWIDNLDAMPRLPDDYWVRLGNLVGLQSGEDLVRMEVAYMLVVSYSVASVGTLVGWYVVQKFRRQPATVIEIQK